MEILLLEDHQSTAQSVTWLLQSKHQVTHVASCDQAHQKLSAQDFDLMIVDLQLPDGSGLQFCQPSNKEEVSTKVLVLSGNATTHHKVQALNAGADDYITKPFSAAELDARVEALSRRGRVLEKRELRVGGLRLWPEERLLEVKEKNIALTSSEVRLLCTLIRHRDHVVDRRVLLGNGTADNALEAQIKNVRKKLAPTFSSKLVETIYGIGYRLNSTYA